MGQTSTQLRLSMLEFVFQSAVGSAFSRRTDRESTRVVGQVKSLGFFLALPRLLYYSPHVCATTSILTMVVTLGLAGACNRKMVLVKLNNLSHPKARVFDGT